MSWTETAVALALGTAVAVAISGCGGGDALGQQALGEDDAHKVLNDTEISIPDGYSFGQMVEDRAGPNGKNNYYSRFDGSANEFTDTTELLAANPEFPPFQASDCSDEYIDSHLSKLGLMCTDTTQVLLSINTKLNPNDYSGPPPDSETFLLTSDGVRTRLFVLLEGH